MIVDFFNSFPGWLKMLIAIIICIWSLGSAYKHLFVQKAFYDAALKIVIFIVFITMIINTFILNGVKLF